MPNIVLIGLGIMAVLLGGSIWWFNRKAPPTSAHTLAYKAQSEQQLHEQFQTISLWMAEAEGAQARQRVVELAALNYPWFKPAAEVLQHIFHGLERAEHVSDFHDRIKLTESIHTYQAAMFDALPFKVDVATRATQGNALNTLLQECWSGKKVPPPSPAPAVAPIPTPRPTPMPAPEIAPPVRQAPVQNWAVTVNRGAAELDRLVAMGDWDSARDALQHVAYGMVDADEQTKRAFTQAMCQFAARDPLYHEVMGLVTTLVSQSPGVLQSKLYPHFPDLSPEMVRYVLYYAAELGDVVRRKKGNSYALFPKGTEPVLVEKPPKGAQADPKKPAINELGTHDVVAHLLRQSTAQKGAGDLQAAVASLIEAKGLMLKSTTVYPAETWCKLALYMQQAGRYEEALAELDFLTDDLPRRARRDARLDDPNVGSPAQKQKFYERLLQDDAQVIGKKRDLIVKRQSKSKTGGSTK